MLVGFHNAVKNQPRKKGSDKNQNFSNRNPDFQQLLKSFGDLAASLRDGSRLDPNSIGFLQTKHLLAHLPQRRPLMVVADGEPEGRLPFIIELAENFFVSPAV